MQTRSSETTKHNFSHYPDSTDPKFEEKLFKKLEFLRNWVKPGFQDQSMVDLCKQEEFMLKPEQDFLRIYMSPATPYNSLLIFWGAGVGKTCAAISIAEGFKESVIKSGQRIFVVVPQKPLEANFRKGLYSLEEERLEIIPGSRQCTGTTYRPPDHLVGLEERQKWIDAKIKEAYHISGSISLANSVDAGELHEKYGGDVGKIFENTVVIIDEAHHLHKDRAGEDLEDFEDEGVTGAASGGKAVSKRPFIDILEEACRKARNMKLILMSATPMRDSAREVVKLFNLLRLNDGLDPIDENQAFIGGGRSLFSSPGRGSAKKSPNAMIDEDPEVDLTPNEEYLRKMTRGYVSYVRGENPITFAPIKDPVLPSEMLYSLDMLAYRPKFDHLGNELDVKLVEQMAGMTLCRCPMSSYQWSHYVQADNTNTRTISNICMPGYSRGERMNAAFERLFQVNWNEAQPKITSPNLANFQMFSEENLGQFSSKFLRFVKNVKTGRGLHYCYSDYREIGVISLAMALEMSGFSWFNPAAPEDLGRLIIGGASEVPLCCALCGHRQPEHDSGEVAWCAGFMPAKYAIITGKNKPNIIKGTLDRFNRPDNRYGAYIKAIIGSETSSTGVDYVALQHVHIMEPWHNYTRIYQAIGRATRHCKHIDLEAEERYVSVYRYCGTVPEEVNDEQIVGGQTQVSVGVVRGEVAAALEQGLVGLTSVFGQVAGIPQTVHRWLMATVDEIYYMRSIRKDRVIKRVERILKEGAIDCGLFRNMNYLPKYDDARAGTRACDYGSCNYTCSYMPPLTREGELEMDPDEINRDTYYLHHSGAEVDMAVRGIIELIRTYKVLTLPFIITKLADDPKYKSIDRQNVMEGLDKIVGREQYGSGKPMTIIDQYGQEGILIMSGIYYLFQPRSLVSVLDPYIYRLLPPKSFMDSIEVADILKSYKKPVIDAQKLSEEHSQLLNRFMDMIAKLVKQLGVGSSSIGWNACVIMAWESRFNTRLSRWAIKQGLLWEILWKSREGADKQQTFIVDCLSSWLERFGVWFPSIEVHLLQRGDKRADVVARCFKQLESTSKIKSLREAKLSEYAQLRERSRGAQETNNVIVYPLEMEIKDVGGFKLLKRGSSANSGKVCNSFPQNSIDEMLTSWSHDERMLLGRILANSGGIEGLISKLTNTTKVDRCLAIEYMFMLLELQTGMRYIQHHYTDAINILPPVMVE